MNEFRITTCFDSPPELENYGDTLQELHVSFPDELTMQELNDLVTKIGVGMLVADTMAQKVHDIVCIVERLEADDDFTIEWFQFAVGSFDGKDTTWQYDNEV